MIIKKTFAHGQVIREIITENNTLLCAGSKTTGASTGFDFADVKNNFQELSPLAILTFESEGESVIICDDTNVALSKEGDLYLSIQKNTTT